MILQAVERLLDEQDVLDRLTKAGVLEVRRFPGAAAAAVAAALEPSAKRSPTRTRNRT